MKYKTYVLSFYSKHFSLFFILNTSTNKIVIIYLTFALATVAPATTATFVATPALAALAAAPPPPPPLIEPIRDSDGSRFGGTTGLFGGIGGGKPRAPAGGTVTGGTAMGTACGWSCELLAAAANAENLPPGARCIVAVGCILAGDGAVTAAAATTTTALGTSLTVVVVIVAAVATPLRIFCPGAIERAIPVVGPETGTLETVAVGCTIFAMLTKGVTTQPSSEITEIHMYALMSEIYCECV